MEHLPDGSVQWIMYFKITTYTPQKSFLLSGPRGTGKSTWVKSVFLGALNLDLLEA